MEAPPRGHISEHGSRLARRGIILPLPRAWPRRFARGHRLRACFLFLFFLAPCSFTACFAAPSCKDLPHQGAGHRHSGECRFCFSDPPRWLLGSNFPVNMCVPTSISENPGLKRPQIAIGGVAKAKWHSLLACVRALKDRRQYGAVFRRTV